jgi:hypothetical protein
VGYYEPTFLEAVKYAFHHDSMLNLYNYQIPEDELKRLRSQNQEWRNDLKVGDKVDAIVDDPSCKCTGWS